MLTFQIQAVFWYFLIIILYFLRSNAIPVQLTDEYAELDYFGIERPVHLNSWAVQVNGSELSADELAKKYGFKNIGKVSDIIYILLSISPWMLFTAFMLAKLLPFLL